MIKKYGGVLALAISIICWGPAPVVSKIALTEIPQMSFAFLSRSLAFIILVLIFLPKGYFRASRKDFPLLFLAGVTGATLNVGFFLYGLQLTTAMNSQAIFTTAPIMTALFAHFFLNEKINFTQSIAVAIGFIGAILIAFQDFFITGNFTSGNMVGNFFILLSAFSWVLYILISKKLSFKYSPITITCYSFLVSSILFAPLAFMENINNFSWIGDLGLAGIFGVLYQGIFASVIAFLAYQTGLKLTSAFAAGVVLYLNPVLTVIAASYLLSEKITPLFIIGTVLIIIGSLIATQYETLKYHANRKWGSGKKEISL